jgi:hypothetical protein
VSEFGVDRVLREVAGVYERALAERR